MESVFRKLDDFTVFIHFRQRRLLTNLRRFSTMLVLVVLTVTLCSLAARYQWRAELIPLLLFGMMAAIAYKHESAVLLSAAISLIVVLSLGRGLPDLVIQMAGLTTAAGLICLAAVGCGPGGGVYVGVAVPGPYVGYPGGMHPGYVGRPPYVYEEDALNLPTDSRERYAAAGQVEISQECKSDESAGDPCDRPGRDQSALLNADAAEAPAREPSEAKR